MVSSVLGHFGPKDRTAHQKDRSAHALRIIVMLDSNNQ